jgi:hypothetical protein
MTVMNSGKENEHIKTLTREFKMEHVYEVENMQFVHDDLFFS